MAGFAVFRAKGASDTAVAEQVNAALTEIAAKHPELTIELISSTVTYTESSYQLTIKTLLEGAFLTIVIVFFFLKAGGQPWLRQWRCRYPYYRHFCAGTV